MLAMGRALMSHTEIILMDEPSMGLSPLFVNEIFSIIKEVAEDGVTVLPVEQNAKKRLMSLTVSTFSKTEKSSFRAVSTSFCTTIRLKKRILVNRSLR